MLACVLNESFCQGERVCLSVCVQYIIIIIVIIIIIMVITLMIAAGFSLTQKNCVFYAKK